MSDPLLPATDILLQGRPASREVRGHWEGLLYDYERSGLAPPHLRKEVSQGCAGELQKLWACLWEAMLYRHFKNLGFEFKRDHLRMSGQKGPDLGLIHEGRTIWIEATVPEPKGLPGEWLASPSEPRIYTAPREAMLLRWTSKLSDKRDKLCEYLKKGIVAPGDAYVIAVNSCMLSGIPFLDRDGGGLPFAVAAVFPVGPLTAQFTKGDCSDGEVVRSLCYSIKNRNDKDVPTDNFLNPEYAGISALIGCSRDHMLDGNLHLIAVHNPLARNPIVPGLLGAETTYLAEEDSEESYILRHCRE